MSMGDANSAEEKYERLGLREALSRDGDYAGACYELARTLRLAYAPLPKSFKSLLLDDALFALRILPDVQIGNAISSANILVQAAEAVLPKQKKALVVSEYKHSVVAHLRRAKAHHRDGEGHGTRLQMIITCGASCIRCSLGITIIRVVKVKRKLVNLFGTTE